MKKIILAVAATVLGLGLGIGIERVRAQSQDVLADIKFTHIGLSVKDVDKVLDKYASQLPAIAHNPVRVSKCEICKFKQFGYDQNASLRTSEIQLPNGMEIHLMQGVGHTPWSENLAKRGEGSVDHIGFDAKDVPSACNAMIAKGGKVVLGDPTGPVSCYIQMPDLPFLIEIRHTR